MMRALALAACLSVVAAQDPAQGWLGYAVGTYPSACAREFEGAAQRPLRPLRAL